TDHLCRGPPRARHALRYRPHQDRHRVGLARAGVLRNRHRQDGALVPGQCLVVAAHSGQDLRRRAAWPDGGRRAVTASGQRAILVTGGAGQVGSALRQLAPAGWDIHAPTRDELNLADPDQIAAVVASRPWAAVISSGAYTAVDRA